MRILYWSGLFWPRIGGIEVLARQYITAMRERGHEVVVITSQDPLTLPPQEVIDDYSVHRFPFSQPLVDRNLKKLREYLQQVSTIKREFKPDIVHLNSAGLDAFFHLHTRRACSCPTVLTQHGLLKYYAETKNTFLAELLESCDAIVGVSQAALDEVLTIHPSIADRARVIYNGLAPPPEPSASGLIQPYVLCAGRLVPEKGFDIAIKAFAEIHSTRPDLRLYIAGDGRERAALTQQINELGLQDRVALLGWVSPEAVYSLMHDASAVMVPSRWDEPFGLVALQAAQVGRPVLASQRGGLAEILRHGDTGYLFTHDSVPAAKAALDWFLQNPDKAAKMEKAAQTEARQRFDLEQMCDSYEKLFVHLIEDSLRDTDAVIRA